MDRRNAILDTAHASFVEHGYAGTTMSSIAAELGGSKGTLWNYFPSKEALFSAMLERATEAYREQLSQILDPCGVLALTLQRAAISLIVKITSAEGIALHRLIIAEGRRFPEMSRIFFELTRNATRKLLATFLADAMERGQLRRADPAEAARSLMSLLMAESYHELIMGRLEEAEPADLEREALVAVGLFLRAYAPEPEKQGREQAN
ncbi:TetR/AcrR family transcriptional regulator [Sphingobium amiense]|uniref:TetR/AcrR family transcriptional regulator n=1 Tax=Sphingobium amiense TaxID=135719 RepID=A0A494WD85_9SPHN|nr:TetR/AcrR family transcriptional regulator [Sphingobium amiense]BBD98652.1 TetR/AcrR family transcriptional regulator [Sphingobium amiense]